MITLTVNGEKRQLPAETGLISFLRELDVDVRLVAVAHNGDVIPRKYHASVRLREGDTLEIVRMVGGGSREVIERAKEAVCRIACGDIRTSGTGFFVTPEVVLTCDHVVAHEVPTSEGLVGREFSRQIHVQTALGSFPASIASSIDDTAPYFYDYAVLTILTPHPVTLQLSDYDSILAGDDLVILGFPFGSEHLVATRGMVAAKARRPSHQNQIVSLDVVEIDGSINVGQSGGPAIDIRTGHVAGLVSVRYGSISALTSRLRSRLKAESQAWSPDLLEIVDILEVSERFLNPGLGFAVATHYVRQELQRLGLLGR